MPKTPRELRELEIRAAIAKLEDELVSLRAAHEREALKTHVGKFYRQKYDDKGWHRYIAVTGTQGNALTGWCFEYDDLANPKCFICIQLGYDPRPRTNMDEITPSAFWEAWDTVFSFFANHDENLRIERRIEEA